MAPVTPVSPTRRNPWKGKAKATSSLFIDPEFVDLEPVITYRHVLSNNIGVKDPLRVIALCDSDAFYAACEMVRLNVDKDVPLVVLQWDSLIAVNYPARTYGISRMIKVKEALKKCPHLKVVHVATYKEGDSEPGYWEDVDTNTHKVSLDYYRRESIKIATKFKESLPPSVEIERASIDEAFFDYTKAVKEILLQRFPYLVQVPKDAPDGIDTPLPPPPLIKWTDLGVGHLIPLNGPRQKEEIAEEANANQTEDKYTLSVDAETEHQIQTETDGETGNDGEGGSLSAKTNGGIDSLDGPESVPEEEQYLATWHDVALSIAAELMDQARAKVREMGYTTSAGIARNKFLAKLTASYKKPNSQSILRNRGIPSYLRPLPFQKIRFLGGKLGSALAKEYDVSTVGDILTISLEELQHKFGESSIWVYEVLRGIDRTEVKEKSAVNKSMLASKNLPKPIKNAAEGRHWIRVLAAELALRLNDARQTNPNLWPKTIALYVRKGYETGQSKQAPFPFVRKVTVDIIANAGNKLWKELVGTATTMSVNHVSLSFTGIDIAEQGQKSIEGFLRPGSTNSPKKRPRDEEIDISGDPRTRMIETTDQDDAVSDGQTSVHQSSNQPLSYSCSRCGKTFYIPEGLSGADDDIRQEALSSIRLEHQDFHFAEDLMKGSVESVSPAKVKPKKTGFKPGKTKQESRKGPQGLDKYLVKK